MARRRFQRGSVFLNSNKTTWFGVYAEYRMNSAVATEQRRRKKIRLCAARRPDGSTVTKREAQRLLQPYVDKVNTSLASPTPELKAITFDAFAEIRARRRAAS